MRRLIWVLCVAMIPLNFAYGQTNVVDNFYAVQQYWNAYYANLKDRDPLYDPEPSGEANFREFQAMWQGQVVPYAGSLPEAQGVITRFIAGKQERHTGANPPAVGGNWVEVGPNGRNPLGSHGRVGFVSFATQSPNLMLTGSPVGGLYYSRNGGVSWENAGTDFLPKASVSDCVVHPTKTSVWFCATGDRGFPDGGRDDVGWAASFGVYRTLDGGAHWNFIGLNQSNVFWAWQIYELVFKPDDPSVIYAATSLGVWETKNAMAPPGSVIWTQLTISSPANNNADIFAIRFQPGSSKHLYASGAIMVKSFDAGITWSPMPNTTFLNSSLQRVTLAVTPANPDLVYAVVINNDYASMYRFSVQNQSWTAKGAICTSPFSCATGSYSPPYGVNSGHAGLAVSPTDADLVYIGDVQVARCLNGTDGSACNWVRVQSGYIHADVRRMRFSPDGTAVWAATDGGIFQSTPSNTPWIDRNFGIGVATIEAFANAATDPSIMLTGNFDNGNMLLSGGVWKSVESCDGLTPMIDYLNPMNMYVSCQSGSRVRSADGGQSFPYYAGTPCISDWFTFSVLNSANPNTFYAAACPEVMRTMDQGATFTTISTFGQSDIWQAYTAPSNPNYLYVWVLDETSPQPATPYVFKTTNANATTPTWTGITPLPGFPCSPGVPPAEFPSGLAVDPTHPNVFYLVNGGYCPTQPARVFRYNPINCPNCWTDLDQTGTLPPLNIDSIVAEPGPDGFLFVGTFAGVYSWNKVTGGRTGWLPYGTGLPHVSVRSLQINCQSGLMFAATFGRGVWAIPVTCPQ